MGCCREQLCLFERLFISHKIYIYNIHCQGISRSISSPTNITLLRYSGDDVAREEQYSKTEQEEKKPKQKQNKKQQQNFDVRGPWDRYCSLQFVGSGLTSSMSTFHQK
jgi:hypothetical protein